MNRKFLTFASLLIIFVFIGYIVYDSIRPVTSSVNDTSIPEDEMVIDDAWEVTAIIQIPGGPLSSVAVSDDGMFYAAGDTYIHSFKDESSVPDWSIQPPSPVTSLSVYDDTLYASTIDQILVIYEGNIVKEWGPFTGNSIITSVSAGKTGVAFCDAGNKKVYIVDKGGEVIVMSGQSDPQFVIPSAYFDVVLNSDNTFWVANTGHRRIEKRSAEGNIESYFGEAGLAPDAFCGCCNPAHFTAIPGGFVTAEKGINRIKILDNQGNFIEFVSSRNNFEPSIPLDISSADGKTIYAANPADSKIYVFRRKDQMKNKL